MRKQQGFSLLEIVLVFGVVGIILSLVFSQVTFILIN